MKIDTKNKRWILGLSIGLFATAIGLILLYYQWDETQNELRKMTLAKKVIEMENRVLYQQRDSLLYAVHYLSEQNDSLSFIIKDQDSAIAGLNGQLDEKKKSIWRLNKAVKELEGSVEKFRGMYETSYTQINGLQDDLISARYELAISREAEEKMNSRLTAEQKKRAAMQRQIESNELKKVNNLIVAKTQFRPIDVSLMRSNGRKVGKKVSAKNWHQTILKLALECPENALNPGMMFAIEIFDITNLRPLAVNETNPQTGNPGNTLVYSRLTIQNTLEFFFPNHDKKEGSWYEARIYFIPDPSKKHDKVLMHHGRINLVGDRKVSKRFI